MCRKHFIPFLVDVLLFEKEASKISSQQKFQPIQATKICSHKPQKFANPQNKVSRKFHAVTQCSEMLPNCTCHSKEKRKKKPEKLFLQNDDEY